MIPDPLEALLIPIQRLVIPDSGAVIPDTSSIFAFDTCPIYLVTTLTKYVQTDLYYEHCCKTSWIAMLHVLPPRIKRVLQQSVVAGCEKLLLKVGSSSTFWNKISTCCAFTAKATLFCRRWINSCVCRDSSLTLSNQRSVITQLVSTWSVCCKRVEKRATSFAAMLQKSCTFSSPFHRNLTEADHVWSFSVA